MIDSRLYDRIGEYLVVILFIDKSKCDGDTIRTKDYNMIGRRSRDTFSKKENIKVKFLTRCC